MPLVLSYLNSESRLRKERDTIAEVSGRGRVSSCSSTPYHWRMRRQARATCQPRTIISWNHFRRFAILPLLQEGCRAWYAIQGIRQRARWYSTKARSRIKKRVLKERNDYQLLSVRVIDCLCFTMSRCWYTGRGIAHHFWCLLMRHLLYSSMHAWYNKTSLPQNSL